ncbi:MAG: ATP-binding protein [Pirellulales bacterium]
MAFTAPTKSIRVRLQIWYAIVLVAVIGGFAGVLYYQVTSDRLRAIDARLEAAASYLEATLRGLPPHELEDMPPRRPRGRGRPEMERFGDPRPPGAEPREPRPPGFEPPRPERDGFDDRGPGREPRQRGDGLSPVRPPGPPPPDRPPGDRQRAAIGLPASLVDQPGDGPREEPYFVIWRSGGSVLATSADRGSIPTPITSTLPSGHRPGFRWRAGGEREMFLVGPRGTLILVGKPARRELAELGSFAWRLVASGIAVLAVGLAGGWLISRSIIRPIAAIARTASEISASNLSRRIETAPIDQELVGLATILNEMFARLEAAFERQSRFTSDASHEMRTPLAVIHSHAELALSRPRSADEYRETLATCLGAASRMATLVDGLLTLARADAGRLDVRFGKVDLARVVQEVVDQYRPLAESARISLSSKLEEPLPVKGDPALLARVSSNLLSNALRYTSEGGRVSVSLRADAQAALLIVEDSGCGIPLEDQGKVFERFFRADKARSRARGGNGLGLAICKSLVEVHKGSIDFTSVPECGTRFEVRLPLASTGDDDRSSIGEPKSLPAPATVPNGEGG